MNFFKYTHTRVHVHDNCKTIMDVPNRYIQLSFGLVFEKSLDSVRNELCSVRFKKMRFSLDITVIYYSCNS